jgi:hypothetical protein
MSYSNFQREKVFVCKDFLNPSRASELSNLFVDYCNAIGAAGDSMVYSSKSVYVYKPFQEILYDKVHHMNALLGIKVLPTYSFARVYLNGAILSPHLDRDACEISVTLNLSKDVDWPIYFGEPGKNEIPVELLPGEAAIYLGRDVVHWRNEYQGQRHVQVFLHYVNSAGPFANHVNEEDCLSRYGS